MNRFVTNGEWKAHFEDAVVDSVWDLRGIELVTRTDVRVYDSGVVVQRRKAGLVKSVLGLRVGRPALTVVVIRNGRVYRRLKKRSRVGKLLERV